MLEIKEYDPRLRQRFALEKARLSNILPSSVMIEHVGSTAVGIGGKNIVDILIGTDKDNFVNVFKTLCDNGYIPGGPTGEKRIFLASTALETGEGDFHIHLCLKESDEFQKFIVLRDYLLDNRDEAMAYFKEKSKIAKEANNDRRKYRELKSAYVDDLMMRALKKASS